MDDRRPYEEGFLLLLIILAIGALVWLFSPFWQALFLALILATATFGGYRRLLGRGWRPGQASLAMTFAVLLGIIAPLFYLLVSVSVELSAFVEQARLNLTHFDPHALLVRMSEWLPVSPDWQAKVLAQLKMRVGDLLHWLQGTLLRIVGAVAGSTASFVTFIGLSVFALFFFYRDGAAITRHLMILTPLDNETDRLIVRRFSQLSTVLVLSVLLVALLQGISFAVLGWLLGLQGLLLGVAVAVASFIPVVGAALVWVPLSIWLGVEGHWLEAALMAIWGAIGAGFLIDNVARPWLIMLLSRNMKAAEGMQRGNHTLITVLSTLAGLIHFGVLGLFFGPVIAAMAILVFEIYEARHGDRLDRR